MEYVKVYAPAREQAFLTLAEFKKKYGKEWKKMLQVLATEMFNSDTWYKQFSIGN